MKNLLTKGIVGCLITALLLWTTAPAIAHAAKEGDKKSTTVMYSLDEINDICNNFESLKDAKPGSGIAKIISLALGKSNPVAKIVGPLYSGTCSFLTYECKQEYNFYKSVRDNMIKKGSTHVTIKYTSKYCVYKMYWEKFYSWRVIDKAAINYYTYK